MRQPTPLLAALAFVACLAPRARADAGEDACDPPGPDEIRDEHLLAQPRLALPPVSPCVVARGRWQLRVSGLGSNSFSWSQDESGEDPAIRRYLIDGEAWTLDATLRRGVTGGLDVGARLPLRFRGGGVLDGLIDGWHGLLHLPDDHRLEFHRDAFRVEGLTQEGAPFSWDRRSGWGLGDLELAVRWRPRDGGRDRTSVAVVGRLSLPTSSPPFDGNGPGGGGQVVLGRPLPAHAWLYAGVGGTWQGRGPVAGVEYAPRRLHAFLVIEWQPWRRVGFLVETDAASRLVTNIERYPGLHWMLNVSGRLFLGNGAHVDLGFTENLMNQRSTTDFGLHLALVVRP